MGTSSRSRVDPVRSEMDLGLIRTFFLKPRPFLSFRSLMGPSMSFFADTWRSSYVWYTTSITENTSISVTSQNALQQSITDDLQQDITNLPGQSQFQEDERDPPPPYSVEDPYSQDDESSAESDESSELEYEDFSPWPKPKPGYTRRLIRRV